jgi:hypothetical protein
VLGEELGRVKFGLALRQWAELAGQDKRSIETHRDSLVRRAGWCATFGTAPVIPPAPSAHLGTFTHRREV